MTDVKRLLDEATPLPWIRPWARLTVHATGNDDLFGRGMADDHGERAIIEAQRNLDLAVYAVNHLPDYEAAVDALQRMTDWYDEVETGMDTEGVFMCQPHGLYENARAALRRLRGES